MAQKWRRGAKKRKHLFCLTFSPKTFILPKNCLFKKLYFQKSLLGGLSVGSRVRSRATLFAQTFLSQYLEFVVPEKCNKNLQIARTKNSFHRLSNKEGS